MSISKLKFSCVMDNLMVGECIKFAHFSGKICICGIVLRQLLHQTA